MSIKDDERELMIKAMKYAFDNGQLVITCLDKTAALRVRASFYNFFKTLARQAKYKRKPEEAKAARELVNIKDQLSLGAYSNGELILTKRDRTQETIDYVNRAFEKPHLPSHRDLLDELKDVEAEILAERMLKPSMPYSVPRTIREPEELDPEALARKKEQDAEMIEKFKRIQDEKEREWDKKAEDADTKLMKELEEIKKRKEGEKAEGKNIRRIKDRSVFEEEGEVTKENIWD